MLQVIGIVCYIGAVISGIFAAKALSVGGIADFSAPVFLASALSGAFFGAVCFVLDDIKALLIKIANGERHEKSDVSAPEPLADVTALSNGAVIMGFRAAMRDGNEERAKEYEAEMLKRKIDY